MLEQLAHLVTNFISDLGYPGIAICMAIESALIPLPSEVIMPFSGYLVSTGRFSMVGVILAGGIGNLLGSWAAYTFGYWGHERVVRRFVRKYGKWILLSEHELDKAEEWFRKKGELITFGSRLLPAIRTVISLPAGIARMDIKKFTFYTLAGSLLWSWVLASIGKILGENWQHIGKYMHGLDVVIGIILVVLIIVYIRHRAKK